MLDRAKLIVALENLKRPTQHGRYAETGYNDVFNDGVDDAITIVEEFPDA